MDVTKAAAPSLTGDQDQLHSMALILGQIINKAFNYQISEFEWEKLVSMVQAWLDKLPSNVKPFSRSQRVAPSAVGELPYFWFLQDFHGEFRNHSYHCLSCYHSFKPTDIGDKISFCKAVLPHCAHYTCRICTLKPALNAARGVC